MKLNVLVSIIMPLDNVGKYIFELINSKNKTKFYSFGTFSYRIHDINDHVLYRKEQYEGELEIRKHYLDTIKNEISSQNISFDALF